MLLRFWLFFTFISLQFSSALVGSASYRNHFSFPLWSGWSVCILWLLCLSMDGMFWSVIMWELWAKGMHVPSNEDARSFVEMSINYSFLHWADYWIGKMGNSRSLGNTKLPCQAMMNIQYERDVITFWGTEIEEIISAINSSLSWLMSMGCSTSRY